MTRLLWEREREKSALMPSLLTNNNVPESDSNLSDLIYLCLKINFLLRASTWSRGQEVSQCLCLRVLAEGERKVKESKRRKDLKEEGGKETMWETFNLVGSRGRQAETDLLSASCLQPTVILSPVRCSGVGLTRHLLKKASVSGSTTSRRATLPPTLMAATTSECVFPSTDTPFTWGRKRVLSKPDNLQN